VGGGEEEGDEDDEGKEEEEEGEEEEEETGVETGGGEGRLTDWFSSSDRVTGEMGEEGRDDVWGDDDDEKEEEDKEGQELDRKIDFVAL
jgi:hypothetical protein